MQRRCNAVESKPVSKALNARIFVISGSTLHFQTETTVLIINWYLEKFSFYPLRSH